MIPCSVELTNFLSHRCADGEPVVFDFDGAVLWSVAGDNGAGKSAIFDAITWTLYGQHRGGTQDAKRLICHGADACHAAFVFTLGGERYRVERSIRRNGGRRSAARWDETSEQWEAISGTATEKGFETWRDGLLGLTYTAFTQSVLLIQGGSDRLITSGAKERFEILAQLVDLSAYKRLEDRARERASQARGRHQALTAELEQLTPVEGEERAAAEAELERLSTERDAQEVERLSQIAVVEGARAYSTLVDRLGELNAKVATNEALLNDAERIRTEAAESIALTDAAPHLKAALAALTDAAEARTAEAAASEQLAEIDEPALRDASAAAEESAQTARSAAESAATRAGALRAIVVPLETAIQRRIELLTAEDAASLAGSAATAAEAAADARAAEAELLERAKGAREAERDGERSVSDARASLDAAALALEHVRAGIDEAVCTRCGQTVPAEHRAAHVAHLEEDVAAKHDALAGAEAALVPLNTTRADADAAVEASRLRVAQLERAQTRAFDAERAVKAARETAAAARTAAAYWDDPRAERLVDGHRAQLETLRDEVQAELRAAAGEENKLAGSARDADKAARTAAHALATARETRSELELEVQRAAQMAASEDRRAEIELARVPDSWAQRARDDEAALSESLTQRLTELELATSEATALDLAEVAAAAARAARDEVAAQIDAVPAAHKVALPEALATLEQHKTSLANATTLVEQAQGQLRDLDQRERRLSERREDLRRAEHDERLCKRLVTLLGRQGIQGQLIVRAARGLEYLANETLRAISGGTLALEITVEDRRGRDEIVISARDFHAGGERTDASFLSGSEKFRVCVAMAAAIGKYASGHSAIESLIIDEGFGSLDETGRDEMIDELQRLAQLLKRVIVVSHQLEFQDRARFPHGYRLRRNGVTTEVERFI